MCGDLMPVRHGKKLEYHSIGCHALIVPIFTQHVTIDAIQVMLVEIFLSIFGKTQQSQTSEPRMLPLRNDIQE